MPKQMENLTHFFANIDHTVQVDSNLLIQALETFGPVLTEAYEKNPKLKGREAELAKVIV